MVQRQGFESRKSKVRHQGFNMGVENQGFKVKVKKQGLKARLPARLTTNV